MRRFLFGPGMGLGLTKDEAIDVFRGLVVTFDGRIPDWGEWRRAMLTQRANDTRLAVVFQVSLWGMPLGPTVRAVPPGVPRFSTTARPLPL